jgi:hypothetical protein
MKKISCISALILIVLFSSACGGKTTEAFVFNGENPYTPQTSDANMQRDDIVIDSFLLALTKSLPPQVMLRFTYFPVTPCHQLRVEVSGPNSQNRIDVNAYSIVEKDQACALMAPTTPLEAALELGIFPAGHYSVFLNGTAIDEFDS